MAQFNYQAMNKKGDAISGIVEANDRSGALSALTREGLRPINLHQQNEKKLSFSFKSSFGGKKIKSDALVIFTRQLSTMVGAGVPLLRALSALQAHSESAALKNILEKVTKDVQSGSALADALEKHPDSFSDVYVNMVRAGETAGILDDILKRLAVQQEKNATMRKKIKGAMTYPIVLLSITVLAFFGLMMFVVPQIGAVITDIGGPDAQLPALTQVMLAISGFVTTSWYIVIAGILGLFYGIRRYLKTPGGKKNFHRLVLKTPIIKGLVIKVAIARFSRTFASLMSAGVSVIEALRVTGRAIGNKVYEDEIDKAIQEVRNGKQLSQALDNNPLFPSIVSQMLSVGEETGQTDQVLIKVADFYEEEVDTVIGSLSSIIEPIMIVIMGSMVGLIVASVIQPITSLAQNIQD